MVITLNSEPFDVTIENEKTLDELLLGLSKWLDRSRYVITNVIQDGIELLPVNGDWGNTSLDIIKKIDIKAIPEFDKYVLDLQTLYQYITLLHDSISISNKVLIEDLLLELPFIQNSMNFFFGKKNQIAYETKQLHKLTNEFIEDETNDQALIDLLKNITIILKNRIKEVTSPVSTLLETAKKLKALIPDITDVSVMLQTGEDKKAISSVLKFIELSESLIRVFPFLKNFGYTDITKEYIDEESFNDFYRGFNDILKELADAFDIGDSILIGDLMEYEVVPKITRLLEYINLIKKINKDAIGNI